MGSRLNFQGTSLSFSTEGSDCLWWLMVSTDVNAVRAILVPPAGSKDGRRICPGWFRGPWPGRRKGRWDLTLANAWGVLAMEKFSRAFEAAPVSGMTRAGLIRPIPDHRLEGLAQREDLFLPVAGQKRRIIHHPPGRRKTLGDHSEPGRHSPERTLLQRLQNSKDHHPGPTERSATSGAGEISFVFTWRWRPRLTRPGWW